MKVSEIEAKAYEKVELKDLPASFTGIFESEEQKKDKRARDCLYVTIKLTDGALEGKTVKQKYSQAHFGTIAENLKKMKVTDTAALVGKNLKWQVEKQSMGNDRYFFIGYA